MTETLNPGSKLTYIFLLLEHQTPLSWVWIYRLNSAYVNVLLIVFLTVFIIFFAVRFRTVFSLCTGALVNELTVVTAVHCLLYWVGTDLEYRPAYHIKVSSGEGHRNLLYFETLIEKPFLDIPLTL